MKIEGYYLDPEYVLTKKGLPAETRGFDFLHGSYKSSTPKALLEYCQRKIQKQNKTPEETKQAEGLGNLLNYVSALEYFKEDKRVYVFQKDFFQKLIESEVHTSIYESLPMDWAAYLAFPEGFLGGSWGVYIRLMSASAFTEDNGRKIENPDPRIAIYGIDSQGNTATLHFPLKPDFTLDRITHENSESLGPDWMQTLARAAILGALYVHTADPDLRHLKPLSGLSKSARAGLKNKNVNFDAEYAEELSFPVELVSWGWEKNPIYKMDQWEVRAHFRNVPCGPDRTERKLTWIPPTVAHRKAGEKASAD